MTSSTPDGSPPLSAGVLLAVTAGGVAGSLLRYLVALALPHDAGSWPWSTYAVNVLGSFALGLLLGWLSVRRGHPLLRPLLGSGVCGGFTTFSTFAVDHAVMSRDGHGGLAAAYVLATLGSVLVAVVAGRRAGRAVAA